MRKKIKKFKKFCQKSNLEYTLMKLITQFAINTFIKMHTIFHVIRIFNYFTLSHCSGCSEKNYKQNVTF